MLHSPPVLPTAHRGADRAGAARPPGRGAYGGITWVGALIILVLVGGGYLAWVWGPVYVEHYEVKQVVRDYMNQAVHDKNDAHLVDNMTRKLASLAQEDGVDAHGRPARVPAVVVEPKDVTWERAGDAQPPTLHVAFDYERTVTYPFMETRASRVFSVDLENDLSMPDWGPAR